MSENDHTKNVMLEDFDWVVPHEVVPLPSMGEIYSPDSKLYKTTQVQIKAMTAKEEDLLTSPALLKQGKAITEVIKSCLMTPGIDIDDMLIGDRNALMISIRITGYGSIYPVNVKCNACGHSNKLDVDLSSLPLKFLEIKPVSPGENLFEYTLPVTKKKVCFKFLNAHDEKERKQTLENMQKHFGKDYEPTVTMLLESLIVSIDGITDKNKIKHFVMNMPAYDSRSLRNYIKQSEPGVDMNTELTCENCSTKSEVAVPVNASFFWPDS